MSNVHNHLYPNQFAKLSSQEFNNLTDAIPLITLLIAGADGQYNPEETAWAEKLTRIRSFKNHASLHEYYNQVGMIFDRRIKELKAELPGNVSDRTEAISSKLEVLNDIFPKLSGKFARRLYKDFVTFAKHVAKSSGGFLSFGSITANEAKLIGLHMIDPINPSDEEEEE